MRESTQQNIDIFGDLLLKTLCGVCTVLLGIAVNSLGTMSDEIKDLSTSVNTLTVSSTVVTSTQKALLVRLEKLEAEDTRLRDRLRDQTVQIEILRKRIGR